MLVRESPCSNPTFRCWSPIFLQVKSQFSPIKSPFWLVRLPIGSMYGIFTYIWVICKANVGKYSIHESYGSCFPASTRSCGRCPGWAIWPVWCPRLMRPASRAPSGAPRAATPLRGTVAPVVPWMMGLGISGVSHGDFAMQNPWNSIIGSYLIAASMMFQLALDYQRGMGIENREFTWFNQSIMDMNKHGGGRRNTNQILGLG